MVDSIPVRNGAIIVDVGDRLLFKYGSDTQFADVEVEERINESGQLRVRFLEDYKRSHLDYKEGDVELIGVSHLYFPPDTAVSGNRLEELLRHVHTY